MSNVAQQRRNGRIIRHRRVRKKIHGTAARPRLAVYRSLKHLTLQVIDDDAGVIDAADEETLANEQGALARGRADGQQRQTLRVGDGQQRRSRDDDPAAVVELDEERKATMISNLLVVLCGDRDAQPVLNTGSLYQ